MEEIQIRLMATQVLGEMFAEKGGAEFMKKYGSTWAFWVARRNDKASAVRLAFVEACKGLFSGNGEMRDVVEGDFSFYKIRRPTIQPFGRIFSGQTT